MGIRIRKRREADKDALEDGIDVSSEAGRKEKQKQAAADSGRKVLRRKWLEICCPCWAEDRGEWEWSNLGESCSIACQTCPLECYDYWFVCPCCSLPCFPSPGPPCIFYSRDDDDKGQILARETDEKRMGNNASTKESVPDVLVQVEEDAKGGFITQLPFYGRFPPPWWCIDACQPDHIDDAWWANEWCYSRPDPKIEDDEQCGGRRVRHSLHLDEQRSRVGRISECQVKYVGLNCCVQLWMLFLLFVKFNQWQVGKYYIYDRTTQLETVEIMGNTIAKVQQFLYGPPKLVETSDESSIDREILRMGTAFCGSKFNAVMKTDEEKRLTLQVDRIDQFDIDMTPFRKTSYLQFTTVNDWFTRRLNYEKRPLPANPNSIVAPSDARTITFDKVPADQEIWIKEKGFTLSKLLKGDPGEENVWQEYQDAFEEGAVIISRLAIQDYHCFHSPVNGRIIKKYHVDGILHSVGVDAMTSGSHAIFNDRWVMIIDTDVDAPVGYQWMEQGITRVVTAGARQAVNGTRQNWGPITGSRIGKVAYVAIGAMCTGSVSLIRDGITSNNPYARVPLGTEPKLRAVGDAGGPDYVTRGGFVGQMAFGGSTVVALFEEGKINFDQDLRFTSRMPVEQYVTVRQQVAWTNRTVS